MFMMFILGFDVVLFALNQNIIYQLQQLYEILNHNQGQFRER